MKKSDLLKVAANAAACFVMFADPAHAGPVAALIGALGSGIAAIGGTVVGKLLLYVGLNIAGILIQKMMQKDPKSKGVRGRIETGDDLPLSFIMGEYVTAGKLVYVNEYDSSDDPNGWLCQVIELSEMPVTSFSDQIWINGEACTISTSNPEDGFFRVTEYKKGGQDYIRVKFQDGTQTTADPWLISKFGGDPDKPWTSDMIGRGCAYAIVIARYSKKGILSGVPQFKFVVRGMKLYNVAKDSTEGGSGSHRWDNPNTWEFSENPKVMQYNIIRGIYYKDQWLYGGQGPDTGDGPGFASYRLPSDYWIAAINHCNENITKSDGTVVKRYVAGCEVELDQEPLEVIKELDKCCLGYTVEIGGQWKTWAGPPGSSVMTITDDDIIVSDDQIDNLFKPIQNLYNGARFTYMKPSEGWVTKDAKPIVYPDLVEKDQFVLTAEMSFPFVTDVNQAARCARAAVLDSRKQIEHTLVLPPLAYKLDVYDVITWQSVRNGYDNKRFLIVSIDDRDDLTQEVVIRETNPADYDYDNELDVPETTGPIKEIRPGALLIDFTVEADQVDDPQSVKDRPAIRVSWDVQSDDIDILWVKYEVRLSGTTKVIAHGTFYNVEEDTDRLIVSSSFRFGKTYQIRFFTQPELKGRTSAWSSWKTIKLIDTDIPVAPTLDPSSDLADDGSLIFWLDIDWTSVAQISTYNVRVVDGSKTRIYTCHVSNFRIPVVSGKTYVVSVRAVGSEGTPGDWSPTSTVTVNKKTIVPTAPTSLTAKNGVKRVTLVWNKSPDSDYKQTAIYRSDDNNFANADQIAVATGTSYVDDDLTFNNSYFYWITFIDRSGNESAKYPASNTGGRSATATQVSSTYIGSGAVTSPKTDRTVLPAPTLAGTSLVQDNTDLNGDGIVDIALTFDWSNVVDSAGNPAASYEVEISRGTSSGGPFTVISGHSTSTISRTRFAANNNYYYRCRARAISFSGAAGSWSGYSNVVKPAKKTVGPSAPTGLSSRPYPLRVELGWDDCPDADYAYTEVWSANENNFGSASLMANVFGRTYSDGNFPFTNGPWDRWYWIYHVNKSGIRSARHPSGTTSTVTDAPEKVQAKMIDDIPVTERYLATNSPNILVGTSRVSIIQDEVVTTGAEWIDVRFDVFVGSNSARNFFTFYLYLDGNLMLTFQPVAPDKDMVSLSRSFTKATWDTYSGGFANTVEIRAELDANNVYVVFSQLTTIVYKD